MGILDKIHEKIGNAGEPVFHFIQNRKNLFKDRKKLLIMGSVGMACLLLLFFFIVVNISQRAREREAIELARSFQPMTIEPEDLFWPDEPDFIPKVELDREPRKAWTELDALPFWVDPNESHRGKWRERIFSVMDEMMENIP